jgi:Ca-activated chloride channel family protein
MLDARSASAFDTRRQEGGARVVRPVEPMNFLWPLNLWWLLVLPLLPALYLWLLRRGARPALRLSSLGVARAAAGRAWRRHVPPALMWLALSLLLLALARPTMPLTLPWAKSTILLAMDISRSMRVADVKPSRMVAAQEAAKAFLGEVPKHIEVGLVTFAGTAQVAQQATLDRPALVGAIDAIQMQFGTAIGNAIVLCLAELFPDHGLDLGEMTFGARGHKARSLDEKAEHRSKAPPTPFTPVAPGSYGAAAIILLSDGRRTMGVDTLQAAKMAADRGVRIYVVGLGTPDGHAAMGEGMAIYLQLDEPTLRQVAQMTGGEYHHAATAEALRSVYQNLGSRLQLSQRDTELTALLAAAAAVLVAAGAALSVGWFGRVA